MLRVLGNLAHGDVPALLPPSLPGSVAVATPNHTVLEAV